MIFSNSQQINKQTEKYLNQSQDKPLFMKRGKGQYIYDFDKHKFVDFRLNEGSLILGHAYPNVTKMIKNTVSKGYCAELPSPLEYRLAKTITLAYPAMNCVRFKNSKSQCIKELIEMTRNTRDKEKILFIGEGYPENNPDTMEIMTDYDLNGINDRLSRGDFGALCLEPVSVRQGLLIHDKDYFKAIEELCKDHSLLFILDEEITGFRLAAGGGTEYYGLKPDMILLGKVIGGGFPLYAVCSQMKYFECLSPQ
ncbi:MAG: aminotransferase class III-fold pyridoxal phosphate-dependent enzyme, partial [Spirochaetota bacterium]|nr:aminotransferase class III-fold pyridoxal phosphate-dependent enzyme [Spirochaetota bacterium]